MDFFLTIMGFFLPMIVASIFFILFVLELTKKEEEEGFCLIILFLLIFLSYYVTHQAINVLPYMTNIPNKDNKYEGKVEDTINQLISKNLECQNLKIAAEELSEGISFFEYGDVTSVIASMKGNFLRIRLRDYPGGLIESEGGYKLVGVEYFSLDNSCKVDDIFLNKRDEKYSDANVKWNKELVAKSTAFLTGFLKDLNELGGYKDQLKEGDFLEKKRAFKSKYRRIMEW